MSRSVTINYSEKEFKELLKEAMREVCDEQTRGDNLGDNPLLTIEEAAKLLNYKKNTLYEKTSKRLIPHIKKGKKLFFYKKDIEAWLKTGSVKTMDEIKSEVIKHQGKRKKIARKPE
jgi:excisionase family DNA binding protein